MFQEPTVICVSCNIPMYHLLRDNMCEDCCVQIEQNDWDELFHAINDDALMEFSIGDSELEDHIAGLEGPLDLTFNPDVFNHEVIDVDDTNDDAMSEITLDDFA